MRKITQQAIEKFQSNLPFKKSNTKVVVEQNQTKLLLFDNLIAIKDADGSVSITDAGWDTRTTFQRLNGLPGVSIRSSKGVTYLNGKEWNGELIEI